jgi:RND family efflux transporter MFP subunit
MRAAILMLFAAFAAAGCRGERPKAAEATPPAKVTGAVKEPELNAVTLTPETETGLGIQVVEVARKPVPNVRTIGGEALVPPGQTIAVAAPVAGTIVTGSTGPTAGRSVRRGETLFRIVPLLPAERDLRISAERDLATARAALDAARAKTARAERLFQDGSGSRRAVEEAQAELATAQAAYTAAQERIAVVDRSHVNQANELVVTAPIDGVVVSVSAGPGQTVAASSPLAQLTSLGRLWVRVPVYAGDARELNLDQGASILTLDQPPDAAGLPARRIAAPPTATPAASAVDVMFELHAGASLQPGERVLARLIGRTRDTATVVPVSALLHDINGGTWVYEKTGDHVFSRRRIEVTHTAGNLAVLARGPQVGAIVVAVGAAELYGIEFGGGK